MPIINGEKYACASCIKGHRVSGCTHHDRELHHINPKGRPVKQCEHCRGARKAKSHHARCECGDKKNKDKDKASSKGEILDGNGAGSVSNLHAVGGHCGCHDGAKCTCGLKRDSSDLKLETIPSKLAESKTKPRLTNTCSESTLMVFANRHHKPCHRLNNTAHTSGMPYKIPRPQTLHGLSFAPSNEGPGQTYSALHAPQRSVDNLPLLANMYEPFGTAQRSVDSLPLTETGSLDLNSSAFEPSNIFFGNSTTNLGSGRGSPTEASLGEPAPQWPWQLDTSLGTTSQFGLDALSTSPSGDYFNTADPDFAIPSAGLAADPLWSAADLPLDSKVASTVEQPISNSGDSNRHSIPGLTTSSSGAQSEMGDSGHFGDSDLKNLSSSVGNQFAKDKAPSPFRMSPSVLQEERRQPPTSMPVSESIRSRDIELLRSNNGSFGEDVAQLNPEPSSLQMPKTDGSEPLQNLSMFSSSRNISSASIPTNTSDPSWFLLGDNAFDLMTPLDYGINLPASFS